MVYPNMRLVFALPSTSGNQPTFNEPYRPYNKCIVRYLASSSSLSLWLHSILNPRTLRRIFYSVASEAWIDVSPPSEDATEPHLISDSEGLDLFLMSGPTPEKVFKQHGGLAGTTPLPAYWSWGHRLCRWQYVGPRGHKGGAEEVRRRR